MDRIELSNNNAKDILTTLEGRGVRLETVSTATGIPYNTLRRWRKGTRFPRKDRYSQLLVFYTGGEQ